MNEYKSRPLNTSTNEMKLSKAKVIGYVFLSCIKVCIGVISATIQKSLNLLPKTVAIVISLVTSVEMVYYSTSAKVSH